MPNHFQYCSDLHLEFSENEKWVRNNLPQPSSEIMILAGDIVTYQALGKHDWFFDWASDNFEQVYWIPGNHEYYYSSIETEPSFETAIRANVHLLNNKSVVINGTAFHFSTLWTSISRFDKSVARGVSDYHVIGFNGRTLEVADVNELHRRSVAFLEDALATHSDAKQVVVTHHVPTLFNYPIEFRHSTINEAFAVELETLILKFQPKCWVYGHHHRNTPSFRIGKTWMLTNQLGYVHKREHLGFIVGCSFEI